MRQLIAKLDAIESDTEAPSLTTEDVTQLRRQLAEGQVSCPRNGRSPSPETGGE